MLGFSPREMLLVMIMMPLIPIIGVVVAARAPETPQKAVWIVLNAVAIVVVGLGTLFSLVYLLAIRPGQGRTSLGSR